MCKPQNGKNLGNNKVTKVNFQKENCKASRKIQDVL